LPLTPVDGEVCRVVSTAFRGKCAVVDEVRREREGEFG
jgi:hypothetical protein